MDFTPLLKALEAHTAALLAHAKALGEEVVADVESAVKRGRGRPAKDSAAPAQTVSAAVTTTSVTPATTPVVSTAASEPSAPQATLKQVADAIVKVCETVDGGRDKIKAILAQFQATKVPELKPADFPAALAAVSKLLTPAAEQTATSGLF